MGDKKISIIIPMKDEENYIASCLESILNSDYNSKNMQIIVINSMSKDKSLSIVKEYMSRHSNIQCYDNQNVYTPFAFNMGVKNSGGEYIFIISAHCQYERNYFTVLVDQAGKLNADAVGAVSKTGVLNHTIKTNSIKDVLSNKFGVGDSYFRIGTNKVIEVDAISGCYHRRVFERYGLYNEKLIRNQDIELNKRIKNNGGKLYLIPYTSYTYFVRENFSALATNNYNNGFWNILTAYYTKTLNSLSLRHFIPLLFLFSLIIPTMLSVLSSQILWLSFFSFISYLSLVIIISFRIKNSSNSIRYLIVSFLTLHFSYGLGSLMGIFSAINKYIKGEK